MTERCNWVKTPADEQYHDTEWGVPSYDDRHLFEMLVLEGAQAGLSWSTILNKRENYRRAFADFDVDTVANFTPEKIETLLLDAGIVRNRAKVEAAVVNARAVQRIRDEHGSLANFVWSFVGGQAVQNEWARYKEHAPASTPVSDALSKALKGYGCKFVGSTICYAFMQAVGMVNDHQTNCASRERCAALAERGGSKSAITGGLNDDAKPGAKHGTKRTTA